MSELIDRQAAIEALRTCQTYLFHTYDPDKKISLESAEFEIEQLPSAQPEQRWIPIKWHDCTDADREKYGFSEEAVAVFDCEMPCDNQSILVTTSHGYVNQDVCYIDEGFSLDSGWDWIDDVIAWMPLPEPYKGEQE